MTREAGNKKRLLHKKVRHKLRQIIGDGTARLPDAHPVRFIAHRQPGAHLCIVPVHSQHRGRLFLPFADDPRTAEVLSKVLLLSKDQEIKDPIILEQIFA